ncbi:serine/threonine protein kinase [Pseudobacteroides cellulosolvens]|uniref:Serine/threonine protein kinase n=1 Tax=Pseudobacteroides cellulosolvens ATCC 35603 = DSM 2933 TaxID=398512 RepID=A0A0L6JY26_9FIRM|nr:serine/threonine-protein kinase [Pseudobacteroides cellulosolvens]KNY30455.1 serine/threonine protein kinase [Pseudobacteroides cellulosolvens ATCC 35603 = DSM 2933]
MDYEWLQEGVILKDRYKIKKELHVSDLSIVYLCEDMTCDMECIVKEYYPKGKVLRDMDGKTLVFRMPSFRKAYDEAVDNFINEGIILKKYSHKNIVKCIDEFKENDTGYIVLEYCEGKTLNNHMKDEKVVSIPGLFKDLFIPLMDAVEHVHKKGIIHRDIKPSNIIFHKERGPVLIDFGAAVSFKDKKEKKIFFSHGFSPLEFYSKNSKQGKFSDVYSVAATIYYYLSGITPQNSQERRIKDEVENLKNCNYEISGIYSFVIMRNLSLNYKKRFPSIRLLKLFSYMEYYKQKRKQKYTSDNSHQLNS